MRAFLKTLFGDAETMAVVAIVMVAEVAFAAIGQARLGAVLIPAGVLAAVARLALR
jgi:hypothetical protein